MLLRRGLSSVAAERADLLLKIYAPFSKLDKNSPEYKRLARSGRVWEDYHRPSDSEYQGYNRLQQEHRAILRDIDEVRKAMNRPVSQAAKQLVPEYAHQSVSIEDNKMAQQDSYKIYGHLTTHFFSSVDLSAVSPQRLSDLRFPDVSPLTPHADKAQVVELRNHLIASAWIAEVASRRQGTMGPTEAEIRCLSALTMRDLTEDGSFPFNWGTKVRLGEYRSAPISVRSNPLRVFPYHVEVPACMSRFIQWRDRVHLGKSLHPLIFACQMLAYFLHIHPFPDGNGRVSRMIMHDYMVRQDYLPVVMPRLQRHEYPEMIKDAQDGNPDELVGRVLTTQLEELVTFKSREDEA